MIRKNLAANREAYSHLYLELRATTLLSWQALESFFTVSGKHWLSAFLGLYLTPSNNLKSMSCVHITALNFYL